VQFRRSDLADLSYFLEIARHRNFRRAGLELGVSASALSHALRGLEERLGVRLLNRTSRSVTLTAAGEALQAAILRPFEDIGRAVDVLNRFRDEPMGRVRLSVPTEAAEFLVAPVLPIFLERYPEVEIEISVSNRMIDVIEGGFDAGIRYGGTVPEDMIAQRLAPDVRWVVVAAPAYLERFGTPMHPNDLLDHRGARIRIGDDSIYRWEFERGDEALSVDVPGTLTVDQGGTGEGRRPDDRARRLGGGRPRLPCLLFEPPPPAWRAQAVHRPRAGASAARSLTAAQPMNSMHRLMRSDPAARRLP
jgi:DNA-binding transcriptional LysR family regulator